MSFHKISRNRQPQPATLHFRSGYTEITVKDPFVITRINPFTKILNIQLNDIIFLLGTNHYTTVFFGITDSITQ